ncbi:hypothetical protein V6N12_003365, partial [Hibiscus sabdariffa]
AQAIVQCLGDARRPQQQATVKGLSPQKINLISCEPMTHVSDIKLIRTDTTLDLSQKAEKAQPPPAPPMLLAKRSLYGACENAEISHAVCSRRPVSNATLHGPPAMELHHPTWARREL